MALKFDKQYRILNNIDQNVEIQLFNIVNSMDTQELLNFSMINKIPLGVVSQNSNNLIHYVLNNDTKIKSELNRLNIIKFLVQNEVNPDQPNSNNQTPLHIACQKQFYEIVKYFISIGVDTCYKDNHGYTPLHYLLSGNLELYESTLSNNSYFNLSQFINTNNLNIIDFTDVKKKLWDSIKNNPFINSLKESIFKLTKYDVELNDLVNDIKYKSQLISNKNLESLFLSKQKTIENLINIKWLKFPNSNDISLHSPTNDSFVVNNVGIIKNYDIKRIIARNMRKSINNLKNEIKQFNSILPNYPIPDISHIINLKIKPRTWKGFTIYSSDKHDLNIILNNIQEHFLDLNCYFLTDNFINYSENTFIGGLVKINTTYDDYNKLYDSIRTSTNIYDALWRAMTYILIKSGVSTSNIQTLDVNPAIFSNGENHIKNLILTYQKDKDLIKLYSSYVNIICLATKDIDISFHILFHRLLTALNTNMSFPENFETVCRIDQIDLFKLYREQKSFVGSEIEKLVCKAIAHFVFDIKIPDGVDLETHITNLTIDDKIKDLLIATLYIKNDDNKNYKKYSEKLNYNKKNNSSLTQLIIDELLNYTENYPKLYVDIIINHLINVNLNSNKQNTQYLFGDNNQNYLLELRNPYSQIYNVFTHMVDKENNVNYPILDKDLDPNDLTKINDFNSYIKSKMQEAFDLGLHYKGLIPICDTYIKTKGLFNLEDRLYRYRLPLRNMVNIINFNNLLQTLNLLSSHLKNNYYNLIDRMFKENVSKIYYEYYIELKILMMLKNEFIDSIHNNEDINKESFISNLDNIQEFDYESFISELKNINSNLFLYTYLFKDTKEIPLFLYYELDSNNYLLYNNKQKIEQIGGGIDNSYIPKYNNYIMVNPKIINESYIVDINKSIPPSSFNVVSFYESNKINIIINYLKNLSKDSEIYIQVKNLIMNYNRTLGTQEEYIYLTISKLLEEVIKNLSLNFVNETINSIILESGLIKNIKMPVEEILKVNFNLQDLVNEKKDTKTNKEDDLFIIYPTEYTNTSLLKQKFSLKINSDIIDLLINNGAYPYLVDNNNKTCIHQLVKYYNHKPIERFKRYDIHFSKYDNSIDKFLETEKINHINKLLVYNQDNSIKHIESIKNFILAQYEELRYLITIDQTLDNYVLFNLELSYLIVFYLILQVLYEDDITYINEISNSLNNIYVNDIYYYYKDIVPKTYTKSLIFMLNPDQSIIDNYELMSNTYGRLVSNKLWEGLFNNETLFKDDINIVNKFFKTINESKKVEDYIYDNCIEYFNNKKYIKENKMLEKIISILRYVISLIICYGIENILRNILVNYFNSVYPDNTYDDNIDFAETVISSTIKDNLYDNMIDKIIHNSISIYNNKLEESIDELDSVYNIINVILGKLSESKIALSIELIEDIKMKLSGYFNLFTVKLINNLYVVCENVLKYIINHNRILNTIETLKSD